MRSFCLLFLPILLLFLSCDTAQKVSSTTYQPANSLTTYPIDTPKEAVVGIWDMSIQTRRGVKNSVLIIFLEDDQLLGKTQRSNFKITQTENQLTWTSKIESPMGALDAVHQVTVEGATMSGTIKAQRRTLDLTGQKRP